MPDQEMTGYTDKDLSEGWEFKILRSNTGAFRNPEKFQAALNEEKRGGWILVEKFDNSRIRFKRPAGTKVIEGDFTDGYDPYRTHTGASETKLALMIVGLIFGLMIGFVLLIALIR